MTPNPDVPRVANFVTISSASLSLLVAAACSEPQCPRGYDKRGDTCYRIKDAGQDEAGTEEMNGGREFEDAAFPVSAARDAEPGVDEPEIDAAEEAADAVLDARVEVPPDALIADDCDSSSESGRNACGGPCSGFLRGVPGQPCNNGRLGACSREGVYVCDGPNRVLCETADVMPGTEICGDEIDNDCDGQTDEPDAGDAMLWYRDCDGDGYAGSAVNPREGCSPPATTPSCTGWTKREPLAALTTIDCDDGDATYNPGISDYHYASSRNPSSDFNCDGRVDKRQDLQPIDGPPAPLCRSDAACNCYDALVVLDQRYAEPVCARSASDLYPAFRRIQGQNGCTDERLPDGSTASYWVMQLCL
jgi:hypothetical protein